MTRTWTTQRDVAGSVAGAISEPSWGTGDQLLAFSWNLGWSVPDRGLYLLDTSGQGGGLLSREILPGTSGGRRLGDAYLMAGEGTVIADVASPAPAADRAHLNWGFPAIVEFSVRTGQLVRTIYGPPREPGPVMDNLIAADPSGEHLLVSTQVLGRIDNGVFTRIAGPANPAMAAAW